VKQNTRLSIITLCFAAFLMSGFSGDHSLAVVSLDNPVAEAGRLPRLRTLPNGDALMSWVEPKGQGHALKFGVVHDGRWVRQGETAQGENWFVNWADFSSVVAIDENFWVAHWLAKQQGGKTYDYDVSLAISHDAGRSWREVGHPHRDGTAAEHGFATIFKDLDGAGIVWLDGREHVKKEDKTKYPEKSGNFNLRYTHINRDGTMTDEQVLDNNTCTCCWTAVASTPNGAIAAWRGRTDDEIRDNRVALLRDGKWNSPKALGAEGWKIAGCPVNGPSISALGNKIVASWFTAEGDRPRVRAAFSEDGGVTFGKPIEIDDVSPLGRIGLTWRDSQSAVVSWLSAPAVEQKKSALNVKVIYTDGRVEPTRQLVEVSSGRDTGVPQMVSTADGLLFAWTNPAPQYGITTKLLRHADLKLAVQNVSKDKRQQKLAMLDHKFTINAAICTSKHE
jgi:hypothetical protein